MRYSTLGRMASESSTSFDTPVSALGFGCMRLPTLGAPDRIDQSASTALIRDAIEKGVNYIDTAWFYHGAGMFQAGQGEPAVGLALSDGYRDRVMLATKLPQQIVKTRDDMDRFLAAQLDRLKTDRLDYYLVHALNGPAWDKMLALGLLEFLESARSRGLIRHAAFSFHGEAADFIRIVDGYDKWAFAQIQYNYIDIHHQAGIAGLRHAASKGLGVVVMEPLKGGRLGDRAPEPLQAVFRARPEGWSPAEWGLRFVWNEPGVSMLLSGMNSASQLDENLRVADAAGPGHLSPDQIEVYESARAALRARIKADCTACGYCQPCPFGVEIPQSLAALNNAAMWDSNNGFLTGYDRVKGKPDACTECGACEDACPQGLPIRRLLKETKTVFAAP